MYTRENIKTLLNKFSLLASKEFKIRKIYLFGSYAKGYAGEESDIDIAVVADNFEGIRFNDRKKLFKYLLETSIDIELHPFRTEDFTEDNPFVKEIIKEGIPIIT